MGFFGEPNIEKMQKKGDARGLIKLLSSKDPSVRYNALLALFRMGLAADLLTAARTQKAWLLCDTLISQLVAMPDPKAVGPLVAVLADTSSCLSPGVAEFAVKTLDKLGWKPARIEDAPTLYMKIKIREYIKNDQWDVCVQIGEPAISHLLELLGYGGWQEAKICDVLKRIGAPAVEPLIAAIGSRCDEGYKSFDCCLVQTLGRINNPRAFMFLMNMLDKNVKLWVRRAAINALGEIGQGAADAAATLLDILKTAVELPSGFGAKTSEDYVPSDALKEQVTGDIRISAAWALGQIGDLRAVDPLIALGERDWNPCLRIEAFKALGNIGDLRAVETLLSALNICLNDHATRFKEVEAIIGALVHLKVKDIRFVDLLIRYLGKEKADRLVANAN